MGLFTKTVPPPPSAPSVPGAVPYNPNPNSPGYNPNPGAGGPGASMFGHSEGPGLGEMLTTGEHPLFKNPFAPDPNAANLQAQVAEQNGANAEIPPAEAIEPGTDLTDYINQEAEADNATREAIWGGIPGRGRSSPGEVTPMLGNYNTVGGKQIFDDALVNKPAELAAAGQNLADIESEQGQKLSEIYGNLKTEQENQQALIARHKAENAAIMEQKQKQLDEASARYSNDLADRGQWWRNPGNILAAIGTIFMAGNNPELAQKVLNNAITADWKQRKELADMDLGNLRSNITAFRQLAEDKDAGDQLALAESFRVAEIEVKRLGAQFSGPLAKAKADIAAKELAQQSAMLRMNVYAQRIYEAPQIRNALIAKEYKRASNADPASLSPVAETAGWAGVKPKAPTGGVGARSKLNNATLAQAMRNINGDLSRIEERLPGSTRNISMYRREVDRMAFRRLGRSDFANDDPVLNKMRQKIEEEDMAAVDDLSKSISATDEKNYNFTSQFTVELRRFEAAARRMGSDPDELLGWLQKGSPELASRLTELQAAAKGDGQAKEQLLAVQRMQRTIAENTLHFYHKMFGGAMSGDELARGAQVISTSANFAKIKDWANSNSAQVASKLISHFAGKSPRVQMLYLIRVGTKAPKLNTAGATGVKKTN